MYYYIFILSLKFFCKHKAVLSVLHMKIALTFIITSLNVKDNDAFYIKACHGCNILKCRMEAKKMNYFPKQPNKWNPKVVKNGIGKIVYWGFYYTILILKEW